MGLRNAAYRGYEALLSRDLKARGSAPCHIGVILDGNRRWARAERHLGGTRPPARGGQDHRGARVVQGQRRRSCHVVDAVDGQPRARQPRVGRPARDHRGRRGAARARRPVAPPARGRRRRCCRPTSRERLAAAVESTKDATALHVNVAVGYGGRHEIADAVQVVPAGRRRGRALARGGRRAVLGGAHRRAPVHQGPARSRPGDSHLGRAAAERLPHVAKRPHRVLFLRRVLARFSTRRLLARVAKLRPARASARPLDRGQHRRGRAGSRRATPGRGGGDDERVTGGVSRAVARPAA